MITFIRRFILSILLAQWIYAEAVLLAPEARPVLDTVTQFLKPPTHDKWIETYKSFQERHQQLAAQFNNAIETDS